MRKTTEVVHAKGCPAWLAWDIPGACKCSPRHVSRCDRCGQQVKRTATECRYCASKEQA